MNYSAQVVGIKVQNVNLAPIGSDLTRVSVECIRANKEEIAVKIDGIIHSTVDGDTGTIAKAMIPIMNQAFMGPEGISYWTGYLHNYRFANGRAYADEEYDGYQMIG